MHTTRWKTLVPAALVAAALVTGPAPAGGGVIDTVNWAPDSALDGSGTGTLAGGSIIVTYTTLTFGEGNAGTTIDDDWDASLATAAATGSGVTNKTGAVLGASASHAGTTQTVDFSAPVTDPILFVNFTEEP